MQGLFTPITEGGTVDEQVWLRGCDYQLCPSVDALWAYLEDALCQGLPVGCDWEATSLNHYDGSLIEVGLSVSARHATARYVPLAHLTDPHLNLPRHEVIKVLKGLDTAGCPLVWYNYKYDGEVCQQRYGWEPVHWVDAMLGVWLEDSNQKTIGLKPTARRLLGLKLLEFEQVTSGQPFARLSPLDAVLYACGDADTTRRIWMLPRIQEAIVNQHNVHGIERRMIDVVRTGMRHGVYLDQVKLEAIAASIGNDLWEGKGKQQRCVVEMSGVLKEVRDEIYALAGGEFDLASPKQIGERLLLLNIPIIERTKTGQVETGKEVLAKYAPEYPVCAGITKFRELETQERNYVAKMIAACKHFGPHVRFPFNTMGAPTGRMSAGGEGNKTDSFDKGVVNVNIQSLPDPEKRESKPYLPNIRAAICANDPTTTDTDFVIVAIDYSQLQMRIAGNLSHEPVWIKSFANGEDIHETNAKLAYERQTIQKAERKTGKTMGFAVLFGATASTVAEHGGISVKAAQKLLDTFYSNAPRLADWIGITQARAKTEKRVKTFFGRTRRLEEYYHADAPRNIQSKGDREAVNTLIQGAEADIFKIACVMVHDLVIAKGWQDDWQQILWVHDELVSRVRRSRVQALLPEVMAAMRVRVKGWPIALTVEAEVGWNWGELMPADVWFAEEARCGADDGGDGLVPVAAV